ncbi:hypothetical protein [Sinomonas susongensis]|uniref:hypothetical protein n=1 Tax=Sinomonas susongensis TaxID=1324851 RepID=UPI0011086A63|nr:hypothetical protein [Sinomonas susongensis]
MKRLFHAVNAVVLGFLATLVLAALALLVVIFSSRESDSRSEGLFGAVYFAAEDRPDGSTWVSIGIQNWVVLAVLWLGFSGLAWASIYFYGWLSAYRQRLADGVRP